MSFDQEWAELKAEAAMRLDGAPDMDPGGSVGKHAQSHTEAAAKSLDL